jgi:hypothetical protein
MTLSLNQHCQQKKIGKYGLIRQYALQIKTQDVEPKTYKDAQQSGNVSAWNGAMDDEVDSIKTNDTWIRVKRPPGCKPLGTKWVFKIKTDENRKPIRHKARLVVLGYRQRKGFDYQETFSPVVKYGTVRSILTIAADQDLEIRHFDVKTAFYMVT